jgi:hypothetical protein
MKSTTKRWKSPHQACFESWEIGGQKGRFLISCETKGGMN